MPALAGIFLFTPALLQMAVMFTGRDFKQFAITVAAAVAAALIVAAIQRRMESQK